MSYFVNSFIVFADQFAKYDDATVLASSLSTTVRNYIDTNDKVLISLQLLESALLTPSAKLHVTQLVRKWCGSKELHNCCDSSQTVSNVQSPNRDPFVLYMKRGHRLADL